MINAKPSQEILSCILLSIPAATWEKLAEISLRTAETRSDILTKLINAEHQRQRERLSA